MLQRVDVVGRHSATALANALDHDNLFLMPLWRTIGRQKWVLKARTLPKTLAITGAVLAVLASLAIFPWAFTLRAKGTIEPVDRRIVFAPSDAEVVDGAGQSRRQGPTRETCWPSFATPSRKSS